MKIVKVEISFPVGVDMSNERQRQLDEVLSAICRDYERTHPGRIMWPFGFGAKSAVRSAEAPQHRPVAPVDRLHPCRRASSFFCSCGFVTPNSSIACLMAQWKREGAIMEKPRTWRG
jgi:hypothetical protein